MSSTVKRTSTKRLVRKAHRRVEPLRAHTWKAYYPVGPLRARVSKKDVAFFAARGVDRKSLVGAIAVLRCLRRRVFPYIHEMLGRRGEWKLFAFSFLVHDRASGVPASKGDDQSYIDFTLLFLGDVGQNAIPRTFCFVRPAEVLDNVAGVNLKRMRGGAVQFQKILSAQSAWYRMLLESYDAWMSDVELLKQVGQYLHYFANISQLVIG